MEYKRTFRFSAAHFNELWCYQTVWELDMCTPDRAGLLRLLSEVHGHNFFVVVTVVGMMDIDEAQVSDWLIDDLALEKVVMEWANINLSVHPDFMSIRARATTERMAAILLRKLRAKFSRHVHVRGVEVWETDDIVASTGDHYD